jgi:hypothetical protein
VREVRKHAVTLVVVEFTVNERGKAGSQMAHGSLTWLDG